MLEITLQLNTCEQNKNMSLLTSSFFKILLEPASLSPNPQSAKVGYSRLNLFYYSIKSLSLFNPLSPHDALKHHFTSLKTDLIFLQLGVL